MKTYQGDKLSSKLPKSIPKATSPKAISHVPLSADKTTQQGGEQMDGEIFMATTSLKR
jgi:hypothetical protein